jgi:hypothetical protein
MNNTDKAMELADDYARECFNDGASGMDTDEGSKYRKTLQVHIEQMQKETIRNNRDCRTCKHYVPPFSTIDESELPDCWKRHNTDVPCTNYDQWQECKFKQLTKEKK